MKTAMHGFLEYLCGLGIFINEENKKELLETEKHQIINLCTEAYELGLGHKEYSALDSYNETFEQTNKL